ncbi:hypothetical protein [Cetacean poxvirus 1]|nr:hypothetical protein [Cetacean poxvirus 1]
MDEEDDEYDSSSSSSSSSSGYCSDGSLSDDQLDDVPIIVDNLYDSNMGSLKDVVYSYELIYPRHLPEYSTLHESDDAEYNKVSSHEVCFHADAICNNNIGNVKEYYIIGDCDDIDNAISNKSEEINNRKLYRSSRMAHVFNVNNSCRVLIYHTSPIDNIIPVIICMRRNIKSLCSVYCYHFAQHNTIEKDENLNLFDYSIMPSKTTNYVLVKDSIICILYYSLKPKYVFPLLKEPLIKSQILLSRHKKLKEFKTSKMFSFSITVTYLHKAKFKLNINDTYYAEAYGRYDSDYNFINKKYNIMDECGCCYTAPQSIVLYEAEVLSSYVDFVKNIDNSYNFYLHGVGNYYITYRGRKIKNSNNRKLMICLSVVRYMLFNPNMVYGRCGNCKLYVYGLVYK